MNFSTLVVLLIVIALTAFAIYRVKTKGGCSGCSSKGGCSSCTPHKMSDKEEKFAKVINSSELDKRRR